jgi:ABC-type glycerol-3-phosphate transport system substrate-binding protein
LPADYHGFPAMRVSIRGLCCATASIGTDNAALLGLSSPQTVAECACGLDRSVDDPTTIARLRPVSNGVNAMRLPPLTRRKFLATTTASTAALAMPHVRGAHAAGRLSVGFWDHWVPGANAVMQATVDEWAAQEKVEVKIDFMNNLGNKLLLTTAAEAQAKSGHDALALATWLPSDHANVLERVDDVMTPLIAQNGPVNATCEYLAKADGHWIAVPATYGSQIKGPCSRIDLMKQHAGIDVQEMYPAGSPPKADNWNLDTFIKAAEACHKAGFPFGIGIGTTADSVDSVGAIFHSFGAMLVDAKGNVTVRSDPVRQALDYYVRLARFFPADAPAWDDASNNKWLISGRGALILNPPSAWAVAKRDAPQVAEQLWTHGMPAGPKGRFSPFIPYFWGIWSFSKNKSAAKSLLTHLSQPRAIEKMVAASGGYDFPPFPSMTSLKTWAEEGPPKGTLYHYPNPYNHQILSIAAAPAPPKIAVQIYVQAIMTKMTVRHLLGRGRGRRLHADLNLLRRHLRHRRCVARHRGPPHVARLRVVIAAHPVHGLAVVPDHQVVERPFVHVDEARLGRVLDEVAQ